MLQEQQVCLATVGVLGDICRAVEAQIAPYCDNIMTQLLSNLKSSAVARGLKPPILSCFGDIALSLGGRFEPYLTHVLSVSASQLRERYTGCSACLPAFYSGFCGHRDPGRACCRPSCQGLHICMAHAKPGFALPHALKS